ncbi:HI1506-related protein [Dyella lutea]|uniref:HI1506-related protein n=1 Tax=Dyella lutea TaxID=2950441 RepID=A0ABT1FDD7_9GAMM|nr:HI1506-related protein [Dyella lutea]MCP1375386.1 HI1506-related protein [Dyella lutea]
MATNTPPAAQKAAQAAKAEVKTIKALVVKSVAKTFRRIGLAFTNEATHLDPSLLSADQVAALKAEPNLVVTEAKVTVAAPADKPATPVVTPITAPAADAAE